MNTGALTDCAGRLGVASVMGGDCGGTLFGRMEGVFEISRLKGKGARYVINRRRGVVRSRTWLRLAKGMVELTKDRLFLAVSRVVGKKRVGHMIRF